MVLRIPILYGDVEYLEESAITVLFKQLKNIQGILNICCIRVATRFLKSNSRLFQVIFKKNAYPEHFIEKCVCMFLLKKFGNLKISGKNPDEKCDIKISLPFMGNIVITLKNNF